MENNEKPKSASPSATLAHILLVALDEAMPGGAFPGGQIVDITETPKEGKDGGTELTCTLILDHLGDREIPFTIQIRSDDV